MGRLGLLMAEVKDLANSLAFPLDDGEGVHTGLTKREWLTGQALMGILANPARTVSFENAAEAAVMCADETIKSLVIFDEPEDGR